MTPDTGWRTNERGDGQAWCCVTCGHLSRAKRRPRHHRVVDPPDEHRTDWRSVRCGPFRRVRLEPLDDGPPVPDTTIGQVMSTWPHRGPDRNEGIDF